MPGSFAACNPNEYEPDHSAGHYEPYDALEKHERRIVDHARDSAFKDMDTVWPAGGIYYDGNPVRGEVKGVSALLFMQSQLQCSLLHRKRFPQTKTYISHAKMLDYTLESFMRASAEAPQVECPLSVWYKRLTYEQKNSAATFWSLFKKEWINAPQLIGHFKTAIKEIDASVFIHRSTSMPFSVSDFDVDAFIATNKQLMELIELLGARKFHSEAKFEIVQEQFRSPAARPAWDHFLQRGVRDWKTWKKACSSYKEESLMMPSSAMTDRPRFPRSSPGLSDLVNRAVMSSSTSSRASYPSRSYGRSGGSGSSRSAFHNLDAATDGDTCGDCCISFSLIDDAVCPSGCPCADSIQFLNVQCADSDEALVGAYHDVLDEMHVLTQQPTQTPADPSKSVCIYCQKVGHYIRDCRNLNGSGVSTPGQRYGTADGFRQGDDPATRPLEYTAWRQEARRLFDLKRKQQRASGETGGFRKQQSATPVSSINTHAKLLKKSHATQPVSNRYQMIQRLNVLLSDEAEALNLISPDDGGGSSSAATAATTDGSSIFNSIFADQ